MKKNKLIGERVFFISGNEFESHVGEGIVNGFDQYGHITVGECDEEGFYVETNYYFSLKEMFDDMISNVEKFGIPEHSVYLENERTLK